MRISKIHHLSVLLTITNSNSPINFLVGRFPNTNSLKKRKMTKKLSLQRVQGFGRNQQCQQLAIALEQQKRVICNA